MNENDRNENLDDNFARTFLTDDKDLLRSFLIDLSTWTSSFGDKVHFIAELTPIYNPVMGTISYGVTAYDNECPPNKLKKYYANIYRDLHDQLGDGDCRIYICGQGIMGSTVR